MEKAICKFNSGMGAILCSDCHKIIRAGNALTENDWKFMRGEIHLPPQYCKKHDKINDDKN